MDSRNSGHWQDEFIDQRLRGLIASCRQYVTDGAPGLPGHQLMLIVAKMADQLDRLEKANREYHEAEAARR